MKRSAKAERDTHFRHVMSLYGFATGFDHDEVYIDFYNYGGGYVIEQKNVHNHGVRHPFGSTRRSNKEFMAFLDGLRAAKHLEEARRIARDTMRLAS